MLKLYPALAADPDKNVFGHCFLAKIPEPLQERATILPFAKVVALLFLLGLFPPGLGWGAEALVRGCQLLVKRGAVWGGKKEDLAVVLETVRGAENKETVWLQEFNGHFGKFVDSCKQAMRVPATYTDFADRNAKMEEYYKAACAQLPATPDTRGVLQDFVVAMVGAEYEPLTEETLTEETELCMPPAQVDSDIVSPSADGTESFDGPAALSAEAAAQIYVIYSLVFSMRNARDNKTLRGLFSSAFELMMRAFMGRFHWQCTHISRAARKAILEAHASGGRATVHRGHGVPQLDNRGNRIIFEKNTHLSRKRRAELLFDGDMLCVKEVWKIYCDNDKVTVVTPNEHKEEEASPLKRRQLIFIAKDDRYLFEASGFSVSVRRAEIRFLEAVPELDSESE